MTEDLIPDGQPQGEREKTLAATQAAGLPTDSTQAAGGEGTQAPAQTAASPPLPSDFDALQELSPTQGLTTAPTERDRLLEVAATTPNTLLSLIIERIVSRQ